MLSDNVNVLAVVVIIIIMQFNTVHCFYIENHFQAVFQAFSFAEHWFQSDQKFVRFKALHSVHFSHAPIFQTVTKVTTN